MKPIVIDLETRSACDLRECGVWQYANHPTTRLLTVAWKDTEDGSEHVWLPGLRNPPPRAHADLHLPNVSIHVGESVPGVLCRAAGRPWVGHNVTSFDSNVWRERTEGFDHVRWVDTMPAALACGMPGGLDAIGKLLWGEGKYEAGKDSLKKAWRATGEDDCEPENVPVGQTLLIAKYNLQDVRLTHALWDFLKTEHLIPPMECRILQASNAMNARGVRVDIPLVRALVRLSDECKDHAVGEITRLTGGALPDIAAVQSRATVLGWLKKQGVELRRDGKDCLAKDLVRRFIDTHREDQQADPEAADEPDEGREPEGLSRIVKVLELRMAALRVTGGKLVAALHATDPDGRFRYGAQYWGAHTGRWAHRRIQFGNLPRPKEGVDTWRMIGLYERGELTYEAVRAALPLDARNAADGSLLYPYLSVDDAASALLRSIIIPDEGCTLLSADLSNIEARVLHWVAGDKKGLETYWDGGDPYLTMAERLCGPRDLWPVYPDPITGKPLPFKKHPYRQVVGKVPCLACGYQAGGPKTAAYAAQMGFDLKKFGVTGEDCVMAWRQANPAIAGEDWGISEYHGRRIFRGGLWYDLTQAALRAVNCCVKTYAGRCAFFMKNGSLICELPSGRRLVYRKADVQAVHPSWCEKPEGVPAVTYWSPRYGWKWMYGGAWAENIVQAIARDILAEGTVRIEDAGVPIGLTVHDEAVGSGEEGDLPGFMGAMTTRPDWLTDFPLSAEGGCSPRYSKTPYPGTKDEVWRNGVRHHA